MTISDMESGSIAARRSYNHALLRGAGSVVILVLATYSLVYLLSDDAVPVDFHVYLTAARDLRAGESPYSWFVYPPLVALGVVPFTFVAVGVAGFLAKLLLVLGAGAILAVVGVRDWRCYAVALLWPPVHTGVQSGNITILLVLMAALVWRFRDRPYVAGLSLGASVAAKFLAWPLGIWLLAVRRRSAAAWGLAGAVLIFLGSWVVVGLSDLFEYPSRLRYLDRATGGDGYTIDALARDLGLGVAAGRVLMVGVAFALLGGVVIVGRRGNELRSFILAIAATLAFSPIVWVIYLSFLLVPVALVRPRLAPIWFLPVVMWGFTHGEGNGTPMETAVVIVLAVTTLILAFRAAPGARGRVPSLEPGAPTTSAVARP